MILGIGTDLTRVARLEKALARENFASRVFTRGELALAETRGVHRLEFLAGRWAAKEAVAKALGCGIGAGASCREIEVLPDGESGRPRVVLSGNADATFVRLGGKIIHLSISHDGDYAQAFAVLER